MQMYLSDRKIHGTCGCRRDIEFETSQTCTWTESLLITNRFYSNLDNTSCLFIAVSFLTPGANSGEEEEGQEQAIIESNNHLFHENFLEGLSNKSFGKPTY